MLIAQRQTSIVGLDGLRAFAALWVVSHHVFLRLPAEVSRSHFLLGCLGRGDQGVAIFFVLSGFLLSLPFWKAFRNREDCPSFGIYALRRLTRIVPGYFACLAVCACLAGQLSTWAKARDLIFAFTFTNSFFASTFFPVRGNAPLWSIGIEVLFYALLPLFVLGMFRCRRAAQARLYGAVAILIVLSIHLLINELANCWVPKLHELESLGAQWVVDHNALGLFTQFLVGFFAADLYLVLAARGGAGRTTRSVNLYDLIACAGFGLIMLADWTSCLPRFQGMGVPYAWPVFHLVVLGLLVSLPFSNWVGPCLDNRFLRWTATLSFGIYLWHMPILRVLETLLPPGLKGSVSARAGLELVVLACAYGVAFLSYYFLEAPVLRWAHRVETGLREARHPRFAPSSPPCVDAR